MPPVTSGQLVNLIEVLDYSVRKGLLKPTMTPDGIFTFIVPHYNLTIEDWKRHDAQSSLEEDATYRRTKAK